MSDAATIFSIREEDQLRADLYGFLSALLARPPQIDLLRAASALKGDASTPLGQAIDSLTRLARSTSENAAEREYNALFIGLARGELLPFASYYMTGFLNEKPLAGLRQDMRSLGIERATNVFEPEDSAASLMEMMGGLITGRFGEPASLGQQRDFFNRHLAPWIGHFYADLEGGKASVLYAPVGAIGRIFMQIEAEAFRLLAARD